LTLEQRIQYAMCHAGPSIVIASLTDICAFLTAALTPIPLIQYFCITVAVALTIALVLLNTWFVAWMYKLERSRMARAAEAGDHEAAKVNGGAVMQPSPLAQFFGNHLGPFLATPFGKVVVILVAVTLCATSPIGITRVKPKYGIEEFGATRPGAPPPPPPLP
jgi:predicted RND superfamily exporter protein